MSIALVDPPRRQVISSKEENGIHEIFYRHWEKMKNQMKAVIDVINVWRSQSIEEINLYADEQMRVLHTDYNHQRDIFDKQYEENLNVAGAYHEGKATDLLHELCNACQLLEFQVAQLAYIRFQNKRPEVITVEEQTRRKKQDKTNTYVHGSEDHRIESIIEDAYIMEENGAKSNDIDQWSLVISSPDVDDRPRSNNNNSKPDTTNGDDPINKCPICFMIFPLDIIQNDRYQHVYEHMMDDEDTYNTTT